MTDQVTAIRSVRRALDGLLYAAQDILRRHADEDGFFQPPSEVAEGGDVTGWIAVGRVHVLRPLQAALTETQAVLDRIAVETRRGTPPSGGLAE